MSRGQDYSLTSVCVKRRAVNTNNEPICLAHNNPLLDSRQYKVEYEDDYSEILTANIIAEILLPQVNEDGH